MFLPPVSAYAVCEWLVLYRVKTSIERTLGVLNLIGGGFVAFGVVVNVSEALMSDSELASSFILWFSVIGGTITAYLLASAWCRLRLKQIVRPSGLNRGSQV